MLPQKYPSSNTISSSIIGSDLSSGDLSSWSWGGSGTAGTGREDRGGEGAGAEKGNGLARGCGAEDTEGAPAAAAKLGRAGGAGFLLTVGKILPKLGTGSGSGSGSGIGVFLRKGSLSGPGSGSARGDL